MKPASLLLAASLAANAALVAAYVTRSPAPADTAPRSVPAPARSGATGSDDALRAALAAGDANALRAAGVSADVARDLALGRSFSKLAERARAAQSGAGDHRWWRNRGNATGSREQQLVARRELGEALMAAFGNDFGLSGGDASQFAFLPPEKRDALRRITQDYDEMMAKFAAGGPQLASDKEKLRLLRAERDRDIAALLSPDERLAYEMRTSTTGNTVRNRYGDAIESEAEFQKIYALQKAFDEKFPREALMGRVSPDVLRARSDGERQLDADLRAAIGDDRYSALRRASDGDLRNVESLVSRLNLSPATTNQVATMRDSFAAESQRISSDASVPLPERRTQIQELAAKAKADVTRALGAEAADAYAQNSPWLSMLQSGMAYSTTPNATTPPGIGIGNQTVFPVMPAGVAGPGTGRQQVFISGTPAPDGGTLSLGGSDRAVNSNMQVMTFSTSSSGDPAAAGGAPGERRMIVMPTQGQPVPAPTTSPMPPR